MEKADVILNRYCKNRIYVAALFYSKYMIIFLNCISLFSMKISSSRFQLLSAVDKGSRACDSLLV